MLSFLSELAAEQFAALIAAINSRRDSDVLAGLSEEEARGAREGAFLVVPTPSMASLGVRQGTEYSDPAERESWCLSEGDTPYGSSGIEPEHWPCHVVSVGGPHWGCYRSTGATDILWFRAEEGGRVAVFGMAPRLPVPVNPAGEVTEAAVAAFERWAEARRAASAKEAARQAAADAAYEAVFQRAYEARGCRLPAGPHEEPVTEAMRASAAAYAADE